jgi:hypothetical protein
MRSIFPDDMRLERDRAELRPRVRQCWAGQVNRYSVFLIFLYFFCIIFLILFNFSFISFYNLSSRCNARVHVLGG